MRTGQCIEARCVQGSHIGFDDRPAVRAIQLMMRGGASIPGSATQSTIFDRYHANSAARFFANAGGNCSNNR
jgi:hypothetical protein